MLARPRGAGRPALAGGPDPITTAGDQGIVAALLEHLEAGAFRTPTDLARQLGISEALVGAIIADLERRGYLQAVATGCSPGCSGCPLRASCVLGGLGRGWVLTPRGRRAASARRNSTHPTSAD
jgi:hypothetical protein